MQVCNMNETERLQSDSSVISANAHLLSIKAYENTDIGGFFEVEA
jgi:hypothetical protein